MKKCLLLFSLAVIFNVSAQTLTNVIGKPEGFASLNGGVTGGEGGPVVTVTTADELREAVDGTNTATIVLVKGTINVVGEIPARGNKTIVGLGTDARIAGGGFGWNTWTNVILQNITFEDAPDDLLKINNKCTNFWIDHCTFSDGAGTNAGSHDGMLDVTRGSKYVTISYNRFFNHDKNILIGHSDSETGDVDMKVTLHHNWFDGTVQRNPRVRYATVHCYNNYYVANSTYSVAAACDANVLVENCYFKNCPIPLQVGVPGFSPEGFLVQRGCFFEGSGTPQVKDKDMSGLFPYAYLLDSVQYVPCLAETYTGAAKPSRVAGSTGCTPVVLPGGGGTDTVPGKTDCVWAKTNLLPLGSDTAGWFWFNDAVAAAQYLPSVITLLPSVSSSGVTSTIQTTKVGPGTDGVAGSAGSITGCLDLGKSATKADYSGGSAVFQLPSCGEFKVKTSRTGDNLFNVSVSVSPDSAFRQTYAYTGSKGVSEINLTDYVKTDKPVWVKITNGATGSLNIHGVDVKSYVLNCPTKLTDTRSDVLQWCKEELMFQCWSTGPAQVSILTMDGKVVDIPFRGWAEAGVENRLHLNINSLKRGIYLFRLETGMGKVIQKFQVGSE